MLEGHPFGLSRWCQTVITGFEIIKDAIIVVIIICEGPEAIAIEISTVSGIIRSIVIIIHDPIAISVRITLVDHPGLRLGYQTCIVLHHHLDLMGSSVERCHVQ